MEETVIPTEWKTHEGIEDAEIQLEGYNVFRKDRFIGSGKKKRGGGVLMYVKEGLMASEIVQDEGDCEALFVKLKIMGGFSSSEIIVGVCYKSPNAEREEAENLYRSIRKQVGAGAVVMGDFNYGDINWETMTASSAEGKGFVDLVQDCFLIQQVEWPTRGSGKILDLVLSTEQGLVDGVVVGGPVANCDHYRIEFVIPVKVGETVSKRERYNYHKADYEAICNELVNVKWDELVVGKKVEQVWDLVKQEMLKCRQKLIPKVTNRIKKIHFE